MREVDQRFEMVVLKGGEVDCQFADVRFKESGWCGGNVGVRIGLLERAQSDDCGREGGTGFVVGRGDGLTREIGSLCDEFDIFFGPIPSAWFNG